MSSRLNILASGAASDAADILGGDNPPDDIASIRVALTNALNRIQVLEDRLDRLEYDAED